MPELPDIEAYCAALRPRLIGGRLEEIDLRSAFLLRSVEPPIAAVLGKQVTSIERLGKRIVIGLEDELFMVIHLMIAGRLHWKQPKATRSGRNALAFLAFTGGTLVFSEASGKKRASLHLERGATGLAAHDRGGLEVLEADLEAFRTALLRENRTLKRALTDPRLLSGIGNAYSDEILFHARLSPFRLTGTLDPDDWTRLFSATQATLIEWRDRLIAEVGGGFPEKVTAFRPEMAVHGRFGKSCPACQSPVQRIIYAANESNYCAKCQTGGRLLADRVLSALLKKDWPRTLEELEERKERLRGK